MPSRPKVVAHRGASSIRPENTIAAFDEACRLGADTIEFDVHATRDGSLVVHHDYLLGRTTPGTGPIHECDLEYVRSLDAGGWFSPEFRGVRVPLLAEVLALRDVEFELEIKGFGRHVLDGAIDQVRLADAIRRSEFTSWNVGMLVALKQRVPEARIGLITRPREHWMSSDLFADWLLGMAEFAPVNVVHVYALDITDRIVSRIQQKGMTVHANGAADKNAMEKAVEAGVDMLSADDVELARQVVRVTA